MGGSSHPESWTTVFSSLGDVNSRGTGCWLLPSSDRASCDGHYWSLLINVDDHGWSLLVINHLEHSPLLRSRLITKHEPLDDPVQFCMWVEKIVSQRDDSWLCLNIFSWQSILRCISFSLNGTKCQRISIACKSHAFWICSGRWCAFKERQPCCVTVVRAFNAQNSIKESDCYDWWARPLVYGTQSSAISQPWSGHVPK